MGLAPRPGVPHSRASLAKASRVAASIVHAGEVSSTNDLARALFAPGAPKAPNAPAPDMDPAVHLVLADVQTRGRGRLGRTWASVPDSSLTASFVVGLSPGFLSSEGAGWVTTAAGLAAIGALRAVDPSLPLSLKWPNDVLCDGRKLGGILCELAGPPTDVAVVVVGVGMNLFVSADRLPTPIATSLQLHARCLPAFEELRDELCAGIADGLGSLLGLLLREGSEPLRERATRESHTLGRDVEVGLAGGEVLRGRAVALTPAAALELELPDGTRRVVTAGDVGALPA